MDRAVQIGLPLAVVAISFLATWFWRYRSQMDAERAATATRIADLEQQMAVVSTQVSPLWAAVQSKIARDLTHPHPQFKEMDELLRQLEALKITDAGRVRLGLLLEQRIISTDPAITDEERESAKIMKVVMRKVVGESASSENGSIA